MKISKLSHPQSNFLTDINQCPRNTEILGNSMDKYMTEVLSTFSFEFVSKDKKCRVTFT